MYRNIKNKVKMLPLSQDEIIFIIEQKPDNHKVIAFNPQNLQDEQKLEIISRMVYNLNLMQLEEVEYFAKSVKKNYLEVLPEN